jgi:hypothetical protein
MLSIPFMLLSLRCEPLLHMREFTLIRFYGVGIGSTDDLVARGSHSRADFVRRLSASHTERQQSTINESSTDI